MRKLVILTILLVTGCSNKVVSQAPEQPVVEQTPFPMEEKYSFDRLDIDKNNKLDFEEFFSADKNDWILPPTREGKYKDFIYYDKNKDSYLSRQEYQAWLNLIL